MKKIVLFYKKNYDPFISGLDGAYGVILWKVS